MKKLYLYLIVVVGLSISSCGGGNEQDEIQQSENTAPTVPNQVYP